MLEQPPQFWWALLLIGLMAGIVSGALGVGSGIVFVPVLILLFAMPQNSAKGTALAVMVPMVLLGALRYKYWLNPSADVNMLLVAFLVLGALPGVMIGTELASRLPAGILRKAFAVFMVIVAVKMFTTPSKRAPAPSDGPESAQRGAGETKGQHDG